MAINMTDVPTGEPALAGAGSDIQQCLSGCKSCNITWSVGCKQGDKFPSTTGKTNTTELNTEAMAELSLVTSVPSKASHESSGYPSDEAEYSPPPPSPVHFSSFGSAGKFHCALRDASEILSDETGNEASPACELAPSTPDNRSLSPAMQGRENQNTPAWNPGLNKPAQLLVAGKAASPPPVQSIRAVDQAQCPKELGRLASSYGSDRSYGSHQGMPGREQHSRTLLWAMSNERDLEDTGTATRHSAREDRGCGLQTEDTSDCTSMASQPPATARPIRIPGVNCSTPSNLHGSPGIDNSLSSLLPKTEVPLTSEVSGGVMDAGTVLEALAALQAAEQSKLHGLEMPPYIADPPSQSNPAMPCSRHQQLLEDFLAGHSSSSAQLRGQESFANTQRQYLEQSYHQAQQQLQQHMSAEMIAEQCQSSQAPDLIQQHQLQFSPGYQAMLDPGHRNSQAYLSAQGQNSSQPASDGWMASTPGLMLPLNYGPARDAELLTDLHQLTCLSDIMLNHGIGQNFNTRGNYPKHHSLYKTELCRSWSETGTCRYGAKCQVQVYSRCETSGSANCQHDYLADVCLWCTQFAHGEMELRPVQRHPKYKTEICRTFAVTGSCPYGTRCRFIHGPPASPLLQGSFSPALGPSGSSIPSPYKHQRCPAPLPHLQPQQLLPLQRAGPSNLQGDHSLQPNLHGLSVPFLSGFTSETQTVTGHGQGHSHASSLAHQLVPPPQQAGYTHSNSILGLGPSSSAMQCRDHLTPDAMASCQLSYFDSMLIKQEQQTLPHSSHWYHN